MSNSSVGRLGEDKATSYLLSQGYSILQRNYRTKLGELDIVAKKQGIIIFCEVKTRIGDSKGKPYEAVDKRKLQHLYRACQLYVLQNKLKNAKLSLQVISIELNWDLSVKSLQMYEVV